MGSPKLYDTGIRNTRVSDPGYVVYTIYAEIFMLRMRDPTIFII